MDSGQNEPEKASEIVVARPYSVIQSLPPRYQWEFTRRHPYYVMFWGDVDPEEPQSETPEQNERQLKLAQLARLALYSIGFTGSPVPPDTDWDAMPAEAMAGIWTNGAVAQVRFRGLAAMLAKTLPREAKREFAAALQVSAALETIEDEQVRAESEFELYEFLARGALPYGDSYLPELFVTLNPAAARRDVSNAVVEILDRFKSSHDIPDRRTHEKKLNAYLAAWDRREGWAGGGYRADCEMTLDLAAKDLGVGTSTVHSQHCQAFRLITGHEYNATLWFRLLGIQKIGQNLGSGYPTIANRRPRNARQVRGGKDVPETKLGITVEQINSSRGRLSTNHSFAEYSQTDLLLDLENLVQQGTSREEIARRLEIEDADGQALDYILSRLNS